MVVKRPRILSEYAVKSLHRLGERSDSGLGPAPLRLKKWLMEHSMTVRQFAMTVCMNRRTLDMMLRGEWRSKSGYIQLHQAYAIEWATKGYVPAWLWLDQPAYKRRIRNDHLSHVKEFETTCLRHVLKYASLTTNDGMLREKARVLSRLFNVQWGEVKRRAWLEAEKEAAKHRADVSHLLAPEMQPLTDDGIYMSDQHQELSDEEWVRKVQE